MIPSAPRVSVASQSARVRARSPSSSSSMPGCSRQASRTVIALQLFVKELQSRSRRIMPERLSVAPPRVSRNYKG